MPKVDPGTIPTRNALHPSIHDLPEEIIEYILSLLSPYQDLVAARQVCVKWNRIGRGVVHKTSLGLIDAIQEHDVDWQGMENTSRITDRYSHSCAYHDKAVYVFGGCSSTCTTFNDLWKLDLSTRTWNRPLVMGSYPSPKACASLVTYKDQLILFGGWSHPTPYPLHQAARFYSELHVYKPLGNRWSQVVTRVTPPGTAGHAASILGDMMVVFGGSHGHGVCTSDIWLLDLKEMSWKKVSPQEPKPSPRYGHSQVVLDDRHLLVIGGCGGPNMQLSDMWLLTLEDDTSCHWREMNIHKIERSPSQMWCHPACKVGDNVVFLSKSNKPVKPEKTLPTHARPREPGNRGGIKPSRRYPSSTVERPHHNVSGCREEQAHSDDSPPSPIRKFKMSASLGPSDPSPSESMSTGAEDIAHYVSNDSGELKNFPSKFTAERPKNLAVDKLSCDRRQPDKTYRASLYDTVSISQKSQDSIPHMIREKPSTVKDTNDPFKTPQPSCSKDAQNLTTRSDSASHSHVDGALTITGESPGSRLNQGQSSGDLGSRLSHSKIPVDAGSWLSQGQSSKEQGSRSSQDQMSADSRSSQSKNEGGSSSQVGGSACVVTGCERLREPSSSAQTSNGSNNTSSEDLFQGSVGQVISPQGASPVRVQGPLGRRGMPAVRPNTMSNRHKQLEVLQWYEEKLRAERQQRKDSEKTSKAAAKKMSSIMCMYVLDVSAAMTDGSVIWQEVEEEVNVEAPEETIFYSLVKGWGELIMFGGIQADLHSMQRGMNVSPQIVSSKTHFISARKYLH